MCISSACIQEGVVVSCVACICFDSTSSDPKDDSDSLSQSGVSE